jgi:hypothetical protein
MPHKDGEGMGSGTCGQRKVQLGDTCGDVDDGCRRADDGMAEEENEVLIAHYPSILTIHSVMMNNVDTDST